MRQFNGDSRIVSLLMSTRTPLVGVDLPDVDVVIFYDVDLRPDMSDHVDSFCRRLALTRDIRILRFSPVLARVCAACNSAAGSAAFFSVVDMNNLASFVMST